MRPIKTATIMALALSACSRLGTIEGDIHLVTADGEVKRGTGARVYLVPESADQRLWATADTLCTQAWHWQEYSNENRRTQVESTRRFWEAKADSLRQTAEGLPPARRTEMLRSADRVLTLAYHLRDSLQLALLSEPFTAAASWLRRTLQPFYASASVDSAKADVDGHYILDNVPRGSYALVALTDARVDDFGFVGWHAAVEVSGGHRRHHLDNDVKLHYGGVCPPGGRREPVTESN